MYLGKGWGLVGRVVDSATESSHRLEHLFTVDYIEKTKIKKKRAGKWPI